MRRKIFLIAVFVGLIAIAGGAYWVFGRHAADPTASTLTPKTNTTKSEQADNFDKTKYSLTDPTSIWVIVNKQHPLQPTTYVPSDLRFPNVPLRVPGQTEMQMRDVAATALEKLVAAADTAGYKLEVSTAYRGYSYQKTLYDGYVSSQGQAQADQQSARPGYSEHQTGLAIDFRTMDDRCDLEACFGSLPEGKWLAANAYQYGFILRYPADKTDITGYEYEPWHFRYIGTDLSQQMHTQNIETLEEFFGVTGGTTYK